MTESLKLDLPPDPLSYPVKAGDRRVVHLDRGDTDRNREGGRGTGITGPEEGHTIGGAADTIDYPNSKHNLASLLINDDEDFNNICNVPKKLAIETCFQSNCPTLIAKP